MNLHEQPGGKPSEFTNPDEHEEIIVPLDPEDPIVVPEDDPDLIHDEEAYEPPPYEMPVPGEGP